MRGEWLLALTALVLSGCPGSIDDPQRFAALGTECPADVEAYLAQSCGSACHSEREHEGQLDLETLPLDRLHGVGGSQEGCDSYLLVEPQEPQSSLLYLKLSMDHPPCGDPMPLEGRRLSRAQLDCVLDWIASQAEPAAPSN